MKSMVLYGKECVGIVCHNSEECIEVAAKKGFCHAGTDSMGKDGIVYWRHINLSAVPSEETPI